MTTSTDSSPTHVRYRIALFTAVVAFFMYVDRACLAQVGNELQIDLQITESQKDWIFSSFFWSYALAQVPSGLLGPRFGYRRTLTIMLTIWSLFTVFCGLAVGFITLLLARLAVGLAEAGAYPSSAGLVKSWFPTAERGKANSIVAFGGRFGFAVSMLVTPMLAATPIGWRGVLVIYGILGIVWAVFYFRLVRESAAEHPGCNSAEVELTKATASRASASDQFSLFSLLRSRNMWLFGLTQFCVNIGWAFLITKMTDMLKTRFDATPEDAGRISSIPPFASCGGMFLGGLVADWSLRKFGARWGRNIPISSMMFVAAASYFLCMGVQDAIVVAVILAVMAVAIDVGVPSIWAFAQDVGGKQVPAALGFGNMLGNFGAACSPVLLGRIQRAYGWDTMFATCGVCFLVAGFAAILLVATRPVKAE